VLLGKFFAIGRLSGKEHVTRRKIQRVDTNQAKEKVRNKEAHHRFTTIRGILVPADWDEEGNAVAVAISTLGEDEYVIEPDPKGQELLRLLRQEVEVIGFVRKGKKDRRTISIKSYALANG
jgi:hypothetical protein